MSETLVVMEMVQGKFGAQVKDVAGNVFNFSQRYTGDKSFAPGTKLDADVFVSQKGKFTNRYINSAKVVGTDVAAVATLPATQKKSPAKPFKTKEDTTMTKQEWKDKDRSQLIGGLSHDAATLVAALIEVTDVKDVLAKYKEVLEGLLKIRDEVK